MTDPLEGRLRRFVELSQDERVLISKLSEPAKRFKSQAHILSDALWSSDTYIVADGCACEYRMLRNGRRQIVRLLLAGDIFSASLSRVPRSDFAALTECQVKIIKQRSLASLMLSSRLGRAWLQALQFDNEALVENIVRIGQKSAMSRTAHFLSETYFRMKARELVKGTEFRFPLNQQDLGNILGISTVHTNRILRQFSDMHLVSYNQKSVTILDVLHLGRLGEFSDGYLSSGDPLVKATDQDESEIRGGSFGPSWRPSSVGTTAHS